MSTPTAVLDSSLFSAIAEAAEASGRKLRLGSRPGGYCLEQEQRGVWTIDTEIFKTLGEVRAFALGFCGGFQRGSTK